MHTETTNEVAARRRRRNHSAEFKSEAIRACQQPGVSMAGVAMARGINANLLRRWVREAEGRVLERAGVVAGPSTALTPGASAFVALKVEEPEVRQDIRIELRRGTVSATVSWPVRAATDCAAWLREILR